MGSATAAPSEVPALKYPIPTERSLRGNHSATAFTPAGMADAWVMPRNPRNTASDGQPPAQACRPPVIDQITTKSVKLNRSPSRSIMKPQTGCITV
jgi:hypothetical protein